MIEISKEEAAAIREKYGDTVSVATVNRQKRKGRKRC